MLLSKCAFCGFEEIESKKIDHIIRNGENIVFVEVEAEVCKKCNEAYFTPEQVRLFEEIIDKLKKNNTKNFIQRGNTFRLTS